MKRTAVSSSAIVSVGYDAASRELDVEFKNRRVYRYREVPRDVHQFLMRTPEKGRYVSRVLSERFAYQDVSRAQPEQDLAALLEASLRHHKQKK